MKTKIINEPGPMSLREFMEYNNFTLVITNGFRENGKPYATAHIENCVGARGSIDPYEAGVTVTSRTSVTNPVVDIAIARLVESMSGGVIWFRKGDYLAIPHLKEWGGPLWPSELENESSPEVLAKAVEKALGASETPKETA